MNEQLIKLRYKVRQYYYYSPFLQRFLLICDTCKKLRRKGTVKHRTFYGIPGARGTSSMTSQARQCNRCYKGFIKALKASLPKTS